MEIQIYFDIVSNDEKQTSVRANATLTGSFTPADFNHDIEDDRNIDITDVLLFDLDESDFVESEKMVEIANKHIDDNFVNIFKEAEKNNQQIDLSDFKSDRNYNELI